MHYSFAKYRKAKEAASFEDRVNAMCETLVLTGTSVKAFWEKVGLPVLLERAYTDADDLLEKWGERFARYTRIDEHVDLYSEVGNNTTLLPTNDYSKFPNGKPKVQSATPESQPPQSAWQKMKNAVGGFFKGKAPAISNNSAGSDDNAGLEAPPTTPQRGMPTPSDVEEKSKKVAAVIQRILIRTTGQMKQAMKDDPLIVRVIQAWEAKLNKTFAAARYIGGQEFSKIPPPLPAAAATGKPAAAKPEQPDFSNLDFSGVDEFGRGLPTEKPKPQQPKDQSDLTSYDFSGVDEFGRGSPVEKVRPEEPKNYGDLSSHDFSGIDQFGRPVAPPPAAKAPSAMKRGANKKTQQKEHRSFFESLIHMTERGHDRAVWDI